tara:strand:+ start:145 stop:429 length:285 start_codon:yes stop_codon:yes gene_type:complete
MSNLLIDTFERTPSQILYEDFPSMSRRLAGALREYGSSIDTPNEFAKLKVLNRLFLDEMNEASYENLTLLNGYIDEMASRAETLGFKLNTGGSA